MGNLKKSKPGFQLGYQLKELSRPCLRPIKRVYQMTKRALAFGIRQSVALVERPWPQAGKAIRGWNWVWQPVFSSGHLNRFYAQTEDPFQFQAPHELEKYQTALRLLKERRYERALELGAAEGVFTEMLAPLCDHLIGLELSNIAVARGKARLAHLDNVHFVQGALPHELPAGPFDLIVVSDILVYFPKDVLLGLLNRLAASLAPGGQIFSMHFLGRIGAPMPGGKAHALMKQRLALDLTYEQNLDKAGPNGQGYDILIFQKRD